MVVRKTEEPTRCIDNSQDTSQDDEEPDSSEKESDSEEEGAKKYFAGCPVHDHHTDQESMCPDDPPCICLGDVD